MFQTRTLRLRLGTHRGAVTRTGMYRRQHSKRLGFERARTGTFKFVGSINHGFESSTAMPTQGRALISTPNHWQLA